MGVGCLKYLQVHIFLLPPLAARKTGDRKGGKAEKGGKEEIRDGSRFLFSVFFEGWGGEEESSLSPIF